MKGKTAFWLSVLLALACVLWAVAEAVPGRGTAWLFKSAPAGRVMTGADEPGLLHLELLPGQKLDINSASMRELELLPGTGEELAEKIVRWRVENGSFEKSVDIMQVDGTAEGHYAKLADRIITGEDG